MIGFEIPVGNKENLENKSGTQDIICGEPLWVLSHNSPISVAFPVVGQVDAGLRTGRAVIHQ
jgi:hypothetical protein